jgi:hypothetical protein
LNDKYYTDEMGEERGTYLEEERCIQGFDGGNLLEISHERPRGGWDDIIQMDLQEIVWRRGLIDLTEDRDRWRAVVRTVMNL